MSADNRFKADNIIDTAAHVASGLRVLAAVDLDQCDDRHGGMGLYCIVHTMAAALMAHVDEHEAATEARERAKAKGVVHEGSESVHELRDDEHVDELLAKAHGVACTLALDPDLHGNMRGAVSAVCDLVGEARDVLDGQGTGRAEALAG